MTTQGPPRERRALPVPGGGWCYSTTSSTGMLPRVARE